MKKIFPIFYYYLWLRKCETTLQKISVSVSALSDPWLKGLSHEVDLAFDDMYG